MMFSQIITLSACLAIVAARLPVLARCGTLDLGTIPCEDGAICTAVNATYSQCLPSRSAARDTRAVRRGEVAKRFGQGGQANLINGTPYTWKLVSSHAYQMNSWDNWPKEVPAFSVRPVYVEFKTAVVTADDAGEVTYQLDGTPYTFQVQARAKQGFQLQVQLTNMSTLGNAQGTTIPIGWNHDGFVNWALAGTDPSSFVSSNPPQTWVQDALPTFGNVTLGKFVLPGSHDAGMYKLDGTTAGSRECNTLTQTKSIGQQLAAGARYFDVRPVISAGKFKTGHYSEINAVLVSSFQGGNGESIEDIVSDINDFSSDKAEVIILRLAHDLNTDVGNTQYRPLIQDELNRLFGELQRINDLYVAPSADVDLTTLTLNELTANGTRSAVLLVFRLDGEDVSLGELHGKGFFTIEQLDAYNEYSKSDDLAEMAADQLEKMHDQAHRYFTLSWTLTQSATGTLLCPVKESILQLAQHAIGAIFTQVLPAVSKAVYPKLLYIDNFVHSDMVALAMAINYKAL